VNDSFANGFSFNGMAKDVMDKMTARLGLEWSIQNNEVQTLIEGGDNGSEVALLTPATGLIGTPEPVTDVTVSEKAGWKVRALLQPKAEPGSLIALDSDIVKGVFKISSVTHLGDTYANPWESTMEVYER